MAVLAFLPVAALPARAQDRGATTLDQQVRGLTVTGRVLMVGAHPDDEDTQLIAWLARGRRVETAYLSLTRGDGGQNLIGNELGEALGAIRTQELLAARRIDGGRQYFARAYDFGFSKNAEETFKHWPHDELLADVVTVIRAFRPHVIVSVWSGTPADGHGHHSVAGILAREAYDAAGDTVRFPANLYGQAWVPSKFYRSARFTGVTGTLSMNVGEYDPVLGRAYGELAGESRAQHRSQGQGRPLQRGAAIDQVTREASRVNESTPAASERSMFDGIDTTFARLARYEKARRGTLDSIGSQLDSARTRLDLQHPSGVVRWLAKAAELAQSLRAAVPRCSILAARSRLAPCDAAALDLDAAVEILRARATDAVITASGVVVEAAAPKELLAFGDSMPVTFTVYNRGREPIKLLDIQLTGAIPQPSGDPIVLPDSTLRVIRNVRGLVDTRPWWFDDRAGGDMFPAHSSPADGIAQIATSNAPGARPVTSQGATPGVAIAEDVRRETDAVAILYIAGAVVKMSAGPIVYRSSDPVFGEQNRPVGGVPAVTLAFDRGLEWFPANKPIDRMLRLTLRSYSTEPRTMSFRVVTPKGLRVDSVPVSLTLEAGEQKELFLRLRGRLEPGREVFGIAAETPNGRYLEGLVAIEYPHISPIRMFRNSAMYLQSVEITVPAALSVAYVQGVGDNVAGYLTQLGVPVSVIAPAELPVTDLSRFTTVVVGPRAYEAHRELVANNARLLEFAKKGGTVVVQYGQQEMARPGILPYPIALARSAQRVTDENAKVTILDPKSRLLTMPNKIDTTDWNDWVQERSLYMPGTIDPRWAAPLEMHDPGEPENRGAVLMSPVGKGMYVYTTLSLFRQIPGGVPGGPRIFVNLLSAGLDPERLAPKRIVQP